MLFAMWIKIHHNQNDVVARRGHLAVKQNGFVIGRIESQIRIQLKRTVLLSNSISSRDPVLDVSRRVPIASLELIFFRIEILLAIRQSLVLAQLVSAVDPIKRRKRRRQKN